MIEILGGIFVGTEVRRGISKEGEGFLGGNLAVGN